MWRAPRRPPRAPRLASRELHGVPFAPAVGVALTIFDFRGATARIVRSTAPAHQPPGVVQPAIVCIGARSATAHVRGRPRLDDGAVSRGERGGPRQHDAPGLSTPRQQGSSGGAALPLARPGSPRARWAGLQDPGRDAHQQRERQRLRGAARAATSRRVLRGSGEVLEGGHCASARGGLSALKTQHHLSRCSGPRSSTDAAGRTRYRAKEPPACALPGRSARPLHAGANGLSAAPGRTSTHRHTHTHCSHTRRSAWECSVPRCRAAAASDGAAQ